MTIAITISAIAGMAIGFRFKVFFVALAAMAAALLSGALSIAHGAPFWSVLAIIACSTIAVQVGYLCGTFAASMREVPTPLAVATASSGQLTPVPARARFPG